MSKTLQLSTVAEGIENTAQMNKLIKLGCEFAQGYYFAKPLTEEQVEDFFLAKRGGFDKNFQYSTPLTGF